MNEITISKSTVKEALTCLIEREPTTDELDECWAQVDDAWMATSGIPDFNSVIAAYAEGFDYD